MKNNLIINNRKYIPDAIKELMNEVINLYNDTEKLVSAYPGTNLTGKHPGLLFSGNINLKNIGSIDTYEDLIEITNSFKESYKNLENVFSKNNIFLSIEIQEKVNLILKCSSNIKTYFYAEYNSENENKFLKIKQEIENRNSLIYLKNEGTAAATYQVLELYEELNQEKENLTEEVNRYVNETTNIGTDKPFKRD